jgi:hypothetical protein
MVTSLSDLPSFFFMNRTGDPQGDEPGVGYILSLVALVTASSIVLTHWLPFDRVSWQWMQFQGLGQL